MWSLDGDEWEGAGMDGRGKFSQNPHCQILYFEVKNVPENTLGGRATPGPTGEHRCFSRAPNRICLPGNGTLPSLSYGRCVAGRKSRYRWLGAMGREDKEGANGKVYSNHHCQRLHFQFKMHQKTLAAEFRPDPMRELMRSPDP